MLLASSSVQPCRLLTCCPLTPSLSHNGESVGGDGAKALCHFQQLDRIFSSCLKRHPHISCRTAQEPLRFLRRAPSEECGECRRVRGSSQRALHVRRGTRE